MKQYVVARLKEASTWTGLALVLTACGVAIAPAQIEAISFVGLFVAGLLGAVTPDGNAK